MMELLSGWEEKEYFMTNLDRLMIIKILYDLGIDAPDYSISENQSWYREGDFDINLRELMNQAFKLIFENRPPVVIGVESFNDESILNKIHFPFKKDLNETDSALVKQIKDHLESCLNHLHFESEVRWDGEDKNTMIICFDHYSGSGMVLKYFMDSYFKIEHLLEANILDKN